jgi:hypothetical protein
MRRSTVLCQHILLLIQVIAPVFYCCLHSARFPKFRYRVLFQSENCWIVGLSAVFNVYMVDIMCSVLSSGNTASALTSALRLLTYRPLALVPVDFTSTV